MPATNQRLSTTGYAVLGLLAAAPGTAYDLTKRTKRTYRFYWPRAESKLYEEVKKLVATGMASATRGRTGNRPKTSYGITAAGRRALRAWVAQPGAGPSLAFEGLVKLTFADFGSKDALLGQLRAVEDETASILAFGAQLGERYAHGDVELSPRAHTNVFVWRFLWEYFHALRRWAQWAQSEVSEWPDLAPSEGNRRRAQRIFRRSLAQARERKSAGGK